ncbi:MAG: AmmeMemoRadiSam system protein B, partial [Actinobacteria bacterium RBG_19FT_COMBO_54_7]
MEVKDYPRLRRLEAVQVKQQGREMIALRDPQGYFKNLVLIPPVFFYIASLCDGNRSIRDLQAAYVRRFGDIITSDQLGAMLAEFDDKLLLDSPKFHALKTNLDAEYLRLPNRPMSCAGSAYAGDPRQLMQQISEMIAEAGKPGDSGPLPLAIIAPHIDLERGRECYGKMYSLLANCRRPQAPLVVILGTCHGEMEGAFALTGKNYLTPFGMVQTDVGLAQGLAQAAGLDGLGDEVSHRSEHSIEVHLPMLCVIFGGADRFNLLPINCNSFHSFIQAGCSPAEDPEVSSFISALKGLISAMGENVFLIASGDLSHVGSRFGGSLPLDPVRLTSVIAKDKEMLKAAEAGDPEGFYAYIASENDQRNICGLPPIYALGKALECEGRLIAHSHWYDRQEASAVTFAGLTFA